MSRRAVVAIVMTAWGAFLLWFAATNTMARFLGPRTYWVAWFGAIALSIAGAMALAGLRGTRGRAATRGDLFGAVLMLIPVALVALLDRPQLGAQAASRKSAGVGILAAFVPAPVPGGDIGFQEIHFATISSEYGATLGITEGAEVELEGFVTHPKTAGPGELGLTRFYISCCAADAVPYTVVVRPETPETFPDDTWLMVEGTLVRDGDGFVVEASTVEPIEEPGTPYLY